MTEFMSSIALSINDHIEKETDSFAEVSIALVRITPATNIDILAYKIVENITALFGNKVCCLDAGEIYKTIIHVLRSHRGKLTKNEILIPAGKIAFYCQMAFGNNKSLRVTLMPKDIIWNNSIFRITSIEHVPRALNQFARYDSWLCDFESENEKGYVFVRISDTVTRLIDLIHDGFPNQRDLVIQIVQFDFFKRALLGLQRESDVWVWTKNTIVDRNEKRLLYPKESLPLQYFFNSAKYKFIRIAEDHR